MKNSGLFLEKLKQLFARKKADKDNTSEDDRALPDAAGAEEEMPSKARRVLSVIWKIVFWMRKVLLAAPVVYCALRLANKCRESLPVLVGVNLQSTGEFAQMISRDTAINVPMMITYGCLGLMFVSRKTIYPWLISIFTLALPVLLLLTNGVLF